MASEWLVLVNWDGDCEAIPSVYQTADSREEGVLACERLGRECPEAFAQVLSRAEADVVLTYMVVNGGT